MLRKSYVRDGHNRVIGSVTSGFTGAFDSLVRDEHDHVVGRTSQRFGTSRDAEGHLVSTNTADPGLLFYRKR